MPSFLGAYNGSAKNREAKFERAVNSFLTNSHSERELIIISDGCHKTIEIYEKKYKLYEEIKLIQLDKQPMFSGMVREFGLRACTGDVVCYLDGDDIIGYNHLNNIVQKFNTSDDDWVYFDDQIRYNHLAHIPPTVRSIKLEKGLAGTSCIAHSNNQFINWIGCDGYGHDWTFIDRLIKLFPRYRKIDGCSYIVHHIPNSVDL